MGIHERHNAYYTPKVEVDHAQGPEIESAEIADAEAHEIPAPAFTNPPSVSGNNQNQMYLYLEFSDMMPYVYTTRQSTPASDGTSINRNRIKVSEDATFYIYKYDTNLRQYSNATIVEVTGRGTNYSVEYTIGEDKTVYADAIALDVVFADKNGSYSYARSSTAPKNSFTESHFSIDCDELSYDDVTGEGTLYFYQTDIQGVISAATVLRIRKDASAYTIISITRGAAYTETTGGEYVSGEQSTMALWTSGRVDGNVFQTYWFGPSNDTGDGWGVRSILTTNDQGEQVYQPDPSGEYGYLGGGLEDGTIIPPPFTERRETYGMTYKPVALKVYDSGSPEWNNDPALPTRCIREYDNVSLQTIAE